MQLMTEHVAAALRADSSAPAIVHHASVVSYDELSSRSDALARGLRARGVARGDRVGLLLDKTAEAVAAIYAAFKLGCAYVPLNPELPAKRLIEATRLCGVRVIVTSGDVAPALRERLAAAGADLAEIVDLEHGATGAVFVPVRLTEADPAAILTTSGSTGVSKGVVITHGNLGAFVEWAVPAFRLTASDRLLSHAPLQFDLSFLDLFAAAAAGACTVLADAVDVASPARLTQLVRSAEVTVWQSVPSAITLLAEAGARNAHAMPDVRCVLFAGERMPRKTLLALPRLFPSARYWNIYGATETNDTFLYEVPSNPFDAPDPLPIGSPLPYVRYRVVDDGGNDVRDGEQGTLLVSAPTVMAGYVAREPGGESSYGPDAEYSTRDLVSMGSDGYLRFHGRTDALVKTNGYRVNTLEIEDQIRSVAAVEQVSVIAAPDDRMGTRLVAFVRLAPGAQLSTLDLKMACARRLPRHAVPHQFHVVKDPLPTSPTGKVDKQRLAELLMNPQDQRPTGPDARSTSHESS